MHIFCLVLYQTVNKSISWDSSYLDARTGERWSSFADRSGSSTLHQMGIPYVQREMQCTCSERKNLPSLGLVASLPHLFLEV